MCQGWLMQEEQVRSEKWQQPSFAFCLIELDGLEMSYSVAHDGVWRGFVEAARFAASTQPLNQAS